MYLQEVFDQLSGSEFSQLSVGGADMGVIDPSNYSRILGHVNLGLTALFTRFTLKERSLTFALQAESDTYQLNLEDLIKITKVLTDDEAELYLNQDGNEYSCFTPSLNVLKVPKAVVEQGADLPDDLKTTNLTVVYRANHPRLKVMAGILSPETLELELPYTHMVPLLYFVASRVHNPVGMNNEFHAGNSYYAKYEAACQELERQGVQVDQGGQNSRLGRGGWV
jgi:hypothetical protein